MALKNQLFVYGTLRRGQPRRHLLEGAVLLSESVVLYGVKLYYLPSAGFPAIMADAGASPYNYVKGELWSIDSKQLEKIDEAERFFFDDTENSLFIRRIVMVTLLGGERTSAWCYFLNPENQTVFQEATNNCLHIESGDFVEWLGNASLETAVWSPFG